MLKELEDFKKPRELKELLNFPDTVACKAPVTAISIFVAL
jgi:hypothetical protein